MCIAKRIAGFAPALIACLLACSCDGSQAPPADAGLLVFVSIPPQADFVARIGGNRVSVRVLVEPGQEPHTFNPTPRQIVELGKSKLYFTIGVAFEEAICSKIGGSGAGPRIVDTREGLTLLPGDPCDHDEHGSEGGGHSDGHEGDKDPHVWLDPKLVKIQAGVICRELCSADPEGRASYEKGLAEFRRELDAVDAEIAEVLAPVKGRTFFVFHPAYAYFGASYGLKQEAVEWSGKSPGSKHISDLISRARAEGVRVVFTQPQFSTKAAETIAEGIGGAVIPLDPLARDYVANLRDMARKIKEALSRG